MNPHHQDSWKIYLQSRRNRMELIVIVVVTLCVLYAMASFLAWNENRPGDVLNDSLLNMITPRDFSIFTGLLTYGTITFGLIILAQKPGTFTVSLVAVSIICSIRMFAMYMVPLDPPTGIIPLRDLMLENSFYSNKVMVRDLFFSGHTSNTFLVGLLLQKKNHKQIAFTSCFLIACLVLVQHVHYTIDVLVAPFAAYLSYFIARTILGYRTRALV